MLKFLTSLFIAIGLLVAPVSPCLGDLAAPEYGVLAAKADPAKSTKGESKSSTCRHCCTSHAYHGIQAPSDHIDHHAGPDGRVPPLADVLLTSRGPSPLLEPPARS